VTVPYRFQNKANITCTWRLRLAMGPLEAQQDFLHDKTRVRTLSGSVDCLTIGSIVPTASASQTDGQTDGQTDLLSRYAQLYNTVPQNVPPLACCNFLTHVNAFRNFWQKCYR